VLFVEMQEGISEEHVASILTVGEKAKQEARLSQLLRTRSDVSSDNFKSRHGIYEL
jgi:hypothetical protein